MSKSDDFDPAIYVPKTKRERGTVKPAGRADSDAETVKPAGREDADEETVKPAGRLDPAED